MENKNEHIKYGDFVSDLINSWGFTEPQATKVANCLDFTTLYECVADYQNGNFGIGRIQTEPEWFITALEWNDSGYEDDDYSMFLQYAQDHKLIDFIQGFWEIEIIKLGFKDCNEYWERVVKDNIDCSFNDYDLNDEEIKEIVNELLNDDYLWSAIDESVDYYISQYAKEKNTNIRGN